MAEARWRRCLLHRATTNFWNEALFMAEARWRRHLGENSRRLP